MILLEGMMSATASLGLILLWDVDTGLSQIDKYLYATDDLSRYCSLCYERGTLQFMLA